MPDNDGECVLIKCPVVEMNGRKVIGYEHDKDFWDKYTVDVPPLTDDDMKKNMAYHNWKKEEDGGWTPPSKEEGG
jgi:hypothetical protein